MNRINLLFVGLSLCFGFNWSKCDRGLISSDGKGIYTSMFSGVMNTTYSIGQFTTSTGGCAAIGMNHEERAQSFYAFNHEKVLEDIAKGGGEYYSSLARLWGHKSMPNVSAARDNYSSLVKLEIDQQYILIKTLTTKI